MAWDRGKAVYLANQERRLAALRKDKFAGLIASPANLGTVLAGNDLNPLDLPASSGIGISFSVPVSAGQLTVDTNTGHILGTPALVADEIHRLGWIESGVDLTVNCAVAGTVTIYHFDNWLRSTPIATGVFT